MRSGHGVHASASTSIGPAGIETRRGHRTRARRVRPQSDLLVLKPHDDAGGTTLGGAPQSDLLVLKPQLPRHRSSEERSPQSDLLVLKLSSARDTVVCVATSIGPAGIETWQPTRCAGRHVPQSDLLVLKLDGYGERNLHPPPPQSDLLVLKPVAEVDVGEPCSPQSDLLVLKLVVTVIGGIIVPTSIGPAGIETSSRLGVHQPVNTSIGPAGIETSHGAHGPGSPPSPQSDLLVLKPAEWKRSALFDFKPQSDLLVLKLPQEGRADPERHHLNRTCWY